jgi:hypothetical protein
MGRAAAVFRKSRAETRDAAAFRQPAPRRHKVSANPVPISVAMALSVSLRALIVLAVFRFFEARLPSEFYAHHLLRFEHDRGMAEDRKNAERLAMHLRGLPEVTEFRISPTGD